MGEVARRAVRPARAGDVPAAGRRQRPRRAPAGRQALGGLLGRSHPLAQLRERILAGARRGLARALRHRPAPPRGRRL